MFYLFIIASIILDQTSKYLVKSGFWVAERIDLLWNWFFLQTSKNAGVAFSLPIEWIILQIITILLILGILFYYFRYEEYKNTLQTRIGYGLIVGSAISHAYDRIFSWYVLDFIWVKYFAIFNFADIFITIWVILLLLTYLQTYDRKSQ